ncbi:MAG: hypothetical protein WBA53_13300, partial [Burkholderiaceae bacterium]
WNVITRTILPVVSMPALAPGSSRENGLGDTVFTAFLSPANPGHWIWGTGPVLQSPTHTNGLIQPFVNSNFASGLYLTSAPVITANWEAESGQQWTVPLGGGFGGGGSFGGRFGGGGGGRFRR